MAHALPPGRRGSSLGGKAGAAGTASTGAGSAGQPLLEGLAGSAAGAPAWDLAAPGLTTQEARVRLAQDGPNELPSSHVNPILKFLGYFWGPMPIMIWLAIAVEFAESFNEEEHFLDFGVLLLLQLVNGLVGWYEERNAGNAIAALRKELALRASVKRDGVWVDLPARELVRGDVVHLGLGCVIPADCDLLPDATGLPIQVDQAALNGESLPKTVHAGGRVFQGTIVKRGEIDAVVTDTGVRTFFGRASALVATAEQQKASGGHFQKLVTQLTLALLFLSLFLVSILAIKLLLDKTRPLQVISIGVVLLVASIPIAMQVVCTSTMAVGAHKLAKSKALVCKLTAIEELAAMDVLCSDKTGTLTKNELSVRPPAFVLDSSKVTEDELVFFSALAARRGGSEQDAIDHCICADVARRGYKRALEACQTVRFVPFDPVTKRTEATVEAPVFSPTDATLVPPDWQGKQFMVMKGAPQVVLALSKDVERIQEDVTQVVNEFAAKGFRCIGVARSCPALGGSQPASSKDVMPPVWDFLGLVPLFDPPRHDTLPTIQKARQLGIEVKMITGDQTAIAKETARTLGMGTNIYKADALIVQSGTSEDSPQAEQVSELVDSANGFAEVFPEHKFQIVQILQKRGHRVGMTGDGVNDAPALKAGDVGIAVKGSTDAARAAADIVLTSDGLSVIIEAIARARMIFERMRNYCIYRIACTTNLLFFFFFSMMFIKPTVINPHADRAPATFDLPVLCLVLIVLLNDGCILTIAYDKVQPSRSPSIWNLPEVVLIAVTMGFMSCLASILLLVGGLNALSDDTEFFVHFWNKLGLPVLNYPQLQTMLYLTVSVLGFLTIFAARTRGMFFSRRPAIPLLVAGVFALAASTCFAATNFLKAVSPKPADGSMKQDSALPAGVIGTVWAYCIIWFLLEDVAKTLLIRFLDREARDSPDGNHAVFGSSFWRVGGDVRTSYGSLLPGGHSILTAVQRVAATDGTRADTARQLAADMEQQVSVNGPGGSGSLISKNSLISASLTADPFLVAGNSGVVVPGGLGVKGRVSWNSSASIGKLSTVAGSPRQSEAVSNWSERPSGASAAAVSVVTRSAAGADDIDETEPGPLKEKEEEEEKKEHTETHPV